MSVEFLLLQLSYFGLFLGMVLVGIIGVFPPTKILYPFAGYMAYTGHLSLTLVILLGGLGHSLGNSIQYYVAKFRGKKILDKFLFFPKHDILRFEVAFKKKSKRWLFFGKLLDPIKLFVCLVAGYTNMKFKVFYPIVLITSIIWAAIFSLIGYYLGKSWENFGIIGVVVIFFALIFMSLFYKFMNSIEVTNALESEEETSKTNTEKKIKIDKKNIIKKTTKKNSK